MGARSRPGALERRQVKTRTCGWRRRGGSGDGRVQGAAFGSDHRESGHVRGPPTPSSRVGHLDRPPAAALGQEFVGSCSRSSDASMTRPYTQDRRSSSRPRSCDHPRRRLGRRAWVLRRRAWTRACRQSRGRGQPPGCVGVPTQRTADQRPRSSAWPHGPMLPPAAQRGGSCRSRLPDATHANRVHRAVRTARHRPRRWSDPALRAPRDGEPACTAAIRAATRSS